MTNKELMSFGLGVIVGVIGTWYFFKNKYAKSAEEEVAAVRDFYKDKVEGLSDRVEKAEEAMKEPAELKTADDYQKFISVNTDYTAFYDHPRDSDEDEEAEPDANYDAGLDETIAHDANKFRDPKIIREDQYGNDRYFEAEVLHFYNEDEVLTDENDEAIENELLVVGHCLDQFNFRNDNTPDLWIRNYQFNKDYHVVKIFDEYRDRYKD